MSSNMIDVFRSLGRSDALALRQEAASLTGTQIIEREAAIPAFDPQKDYSAYPEGAPVTDDGQVFKLLLPHNASYYMGRPSDENMRALWSICHTTDPAKAKPWMPPYGQSGMYMQNECYRDEDGVVWRAIQNNVVYSAEEMPGYWEEVIS